MIMSVQRNLNFLEVIASYLYGLVDTKWNWVLNHRGDHHE